MIRKEQADALFYKEFGDLKRKHYFSHGRIEILGNHTDHNNGLCLVGGSTLGITASVSKNDVEAIHIASTGYKPYKIDLCSLEAEPGEKGTSLALTKGVVFALKKLGYRIGGFFAALDSDIPAGSGVSSSACYEALIGEIINDLYNDGGIPPQDLAFASQYAEVLYFGKPCGMLDQVGCCYGGVNYLDFKDAQNPIIEPLEFALPLIPVLVLTKSSHEGLDSLYASIPNDMKRVAMNVFGKNVLREVNPQDFYRCIASPTVGVSEIAKLRATHYMEENKRVLDARRAILEHDVATFLRNVKMSGESSKTMLQNTMVPGCYKNSPQEAVDIAQRFLGNGACRIMGGGFAGSILCFLLPSEKEGFIAAMSKIYGKKNVLEQSFTPGGAKMIDED